MKKGKRSKRGGSREEKQEAEEEEEEGVVRKEEDEWSFCKRQMFTSHYIFGARHFQPKTPPYVPDRHLRRPARRCRPFARTVRESE